MRATGLGLGPMVTRALNFPLAQLRGACEYTTGNDWCERTSSRQVEAWATRPVTCTVPPLAGTRAGAALAASTNGGNGAADAPGWRASPASAASNPAVRDFSMGPCSPLLPGRALRACCDLGKKCGHPSAA